MNIPMPKRMSGQEVCEKFNEGLEAGVLWTEYYYTEKDVEVMLHSIAEALTTALPGAITEELKKRVQNVNKKVSVPKDSTGHYNGSPIVFSDQFWDCECREDFIHPNTNIMCVACGAIRVDQPPSRGNEVATGKHRAPVV